MNPLFQSNFRLLLDAGFAIEIEAYGFVWDMHNYSDFLGFHYAAETQTVTLSWQFLSYETPTAPKFPAEHVDIVFFHVDHFEVSQRDPAMPANEDRTFATVSLMMPDDDLRDYLHNNLIPCAHLPWQDWSINYHILFRFHGEQMIRIGAERAEFHLLPDEPA